MNFAAILKDAEALAEAFVEQFAGAYLAKSAGVAGAPAITAKNIGKMAAILAATSVIGAIQAANAPAPSATTSPTA